MSLKIDRVQLEIVIQQDNARQRMMQLEGDMKKARKELKGMTEGTAEWIAKSEELKKMQKEYDTIVEKIGITGLSVRELRKRQQELNAVLNQLPGDSPLYAQYKKQIDEINLRMRELKGNAVEAKFSLSKLADGFNRYAGMAAGFLASLTGITLAARKSVDDFAKLEEAEANVRKYTGMTREEVKELNEEFKKMNTRTARTELNDLAADAGRLGIKGKQNLLDFAEAGNIIRVALGEDLGEDAIKNIGKLSQMFGDADKIGLKQAMLAIGSSINEVAQNSSAAESYLVDFTARLAGVGKQANLSIPQVMGFASVLDQNMQKVEMAATAMQGLIMKLYKDPAKFAKIAGLDVKQFTDLVKKDANEAVLQLLNTLGKLGGMDKLAPVFDEMKLDGARAASVLSVLAGKIDNVRKEQQLAAVAFKDATSATNEYNVKNDTLQAEIEKAKKGFQEVSYQLGEKLAPHMGSVISKGGTLVRGLVALVDIGLRYGHVILWLVGVLGTYLAAQKLVVLWETRLKDVQLLSIATTKLKNTWNRIVAASTWLYIAATSALAGKTVTARLATEAFFKTLKIHPFVAIATAVIALGGALYLLLRRTTATKAAMESMLKVSQQANANIVSEKTQVEALLKSARDETKSKAERLEAIRRLNAISPKYLSTLRLESIETDNAKKSVDKYIESVLRLAKIEAAKDRLTQIDAELSGLQQDDKDRESFGGAIKGIGWNLANMATFGLIESKGERIQGEMKNLKAEAEALKKFIGEQFQQDLADSAATSTVRSIEQVTQELEGAKKRVEELLNMDDFQKSKLEYPYKSVLADVRAKVKELEAEKKKLEQPAGGGGELDDKELKALLKKREDELKTAMQTEQNIWKQNLMNKTVTEGEYLQAMYDTEQMFLLSKKALLEKYGQDTSEIQGQIYDKMIAEANRLYKAKQDSDKKMRGGESKALESSYQADQTALKQAYLDGEIKTQEEFHAKMKELERDYLYSLLRMQEKYGEDTSKTAEKIVDGQIKQKQDDKDKQKQDYEKQLDNAVSFDDRKNILQAMYDADLISYDEYEKQKTKITEDQQKQREEITKAAFNVVAQAASAASDVVNALMDREISKVSARYDKQIKAAKKAGKDTTKLEEAKEEEINAVKKKYADKQFLASVLQVTATTAVTAMEAYKAMAGIPYVGPVLGAIAAAAAVASGAAQIAVAKNARDEAKGLKSGGYSQDYVEGYTDNGDPDDVAGVIPVHKNEFVGNHLGVANPHVKQFYDIFDTAQKNGTIRMLNTTQILEQVRTKSGKYSGGYTDDYEPASDSNSIGFSGTGTDNPILKRVIVLMEQSVGLLTIISKKELNVDPRSVRDAIKRVEKLESNVSRS